MSVHSFVCPIVLPSGSYQNPSTSQNHAYQPNISLSQPFCHYHHQQIIHNATSADMEKHISITYDPVDGFQSVRGHFGVVSQGQSNGQITHQLTWKKHLQFQNFKVSEVILGQFSVMKATPALQMSIHLSVSLLPKPLSLSESCLSAKSQPISDYLPLLAGGDKW